MKSSWKTSLAGVGSILGGLLTLVHMGQAGTVDAAQITAGLSAITAGIGLLFARDHNVSSEQAGVSPAQQQAVAQIAAAAPAPQSAIRNPSGLEAAPGGKPQSAIPLAVLSFGLLCGATACAPLAPGANPLVVRTEQAETAAYNTFHTFLILDDVAMKNASVSNAWAGAAHPFAVYLRQPVANGTNPVPFGIATILSVDQIKLAYQAGTTSSNALVTALDTLSATVAQASQYTGLFTTNPPNK